MATKNLNRNNWKSKCCYVLNLLKKKKYINLYSSYLKFCLIYTNCINKVILARVNFKILKVLFHESL